MTFQNLLDKLQKLTPEQLNSDVTVCDSNRDEFVPVFEFKISDASNDVLDEGHPFLSF